MPKFSKRSLKNLESVHPDLQDLFQIVVRHIDCSVIDGRRSFEDQQKAFDSGNSKARPGQSPHNFGLAVDVVPYPLDWNDRESFERLALFTKGVAAGLGVNIVWGGDFKSFYDGPHYELENWPALKERDPSCQ